jgi:hypothetical protein
MVSKSNTRIYKSGSRHSLYLRKDLIEDTAFPFKVGEPLIIIIEGDKLVIERKSK